ncbi:unnamed protein product [Oikopleura dioica]|uniref:Glucose-methanol-choline oxidoreductase C-terminal domain-containing protein n=1 Tax=Oikopleura dioica TaxID=34765 RepID=E4XVT7_OIKDI|nr:unnamed protein product [Oikopleura dioica]
MRSRIANEISLTSFVSSRFVHSSLFFTFFLQPSDSMTVVNSNCQVLGVQNLRVVDSSIMPSVASGNLNAPTIAIAERAADIIRRMKPLVSRFLKE